MKRDATENAIFWISHIVIWGCIIYGIYKIASIRNEVKARCEGGVLVANFLGDPSYYCYREAK